MSTTPAEDDALAEVPRDLPTSGPKVDRIVALLREYLTGLPEGTETPSERMIARHFGVARMTARAAVDRLQEQGMIERIPRRGTFTSRPRFIHTRRLSSYADDMVSRGLTPGGCTVTARVGSADAEQAESLGIEPGGPILHLVRVRTADDAPMAVTRSMLSLDRFPELESAELPEGSLHEVLREGWGVRAESHEQEVRAVLVSPQDAELLEVPEGSPGLEMLGVSRSGDGGVIEVARSVYRADRYAIMMRTDLRTIS